MENNEIKLLYAKDAIFKLIGQYCRCFKGDDGNYYMSDYYESALERSFEVLDFDKDEVPLMEFCQAWEDNNRQIWNVNLSDMEYGGLKAKDYYDFLIEDYSKFTVAYDTFIKKAKGKQDENY